MLTTRRSLWIILAVLLLTLPITAGILRVTGRIDSATFKDTMVGMLITVLGGLVTGAVAERFMRRPRNDTEQLIGYGATTALGTLTIGLLYLGHIRGPMSTIGTLSRAIEQVFSFVEFLTAMAAGMLLSARFLHTP